MLVHARRQLYRSRRLAAVCFRLLAAPAECSVGDPEEKTGQKFTNTKDDRFIDKVAHATSNLWKKETCMGKDSGLHRRCRFASAQQEASEAQVAIATSSGAGKALSGPSQMVVMEVKAVML